MLSDHESLLYKGGQKRFFYTGRRNNSENIFKSGCFWHAPSLMRREVSLVACIWNREGTGVKSYDQGL